MPTNTTTDWGKIVRERNKRSSSVGDFNLDFAGDFNLDFVPDILKRAYSHSVMGMGIKLATGIDVDVKNEPVGVLEDIATTALSLFIFDAPLLLFGGGIGSRLAGSVIKKLAVGGATKKAATLAVKEALRKPITQATFRSIAGGTEFGIYSGFHSAVSQKLHDGSIDTKKLAKDAALGAVLGGATGAVGGALTAKGASALTKTAAETGAFGTLSPVLFEGRAPKPSDYVHAAGTIVALRGLHTAKSTAKKRLLTQKINKKNFTPEDRRELAELQARNVEDRLKKEVWISQDDKRRSVLIENSRVKKLDKEPPSVKRQPKTVSNNKTIQDAYEQVLRELPEHISKDITIEKISVGKFPAESRGEGGRFEIGAKDKHYISIEKGEPNLVETLKHEMLHSYVWNHNELTRGKGYFGHENAIKKLEAEINDPNLRVEKSSTIEKTPRKVKMFDLRDAKTGETFSMPQSQFFKQFDLSAKTKTAKGLRRSRLGTQHQLQKKLGMSDAEAKNLKRETVGKESGKDFTPEEQVLYNETLKREVEIKKLADSIPEQVDLYTGSIWDNVVPKQVREPFERARTRLMRSPFGSAMTKLVENYSSMGKRIFGGFQKYLEPLRKLSEKEQNQVSDLLEKHGVHIASRKDQLIAEGVRPAVVQAAINARFALDAFYVDQKAKGVPVEQREQNYFPRVIRQDVADIMYNDLLGMAVKEKLLHEKFTTDKATVDRLSEVIRKMTLNKKYSERTRNALTHLVRSGQARNYKEAYDMLQGKIHGLEYQPHGNLEKRRTADLPAEYYDRNAASVLARYFMKGAKRAAFVRTFGAKGEVAKALLDKASLEDPKMAHVMEQVYRMSTGLIESDPASNFKSPVTRKFAEDLMAFEMATKIALGFATIPNVTQFMISTAAEAGYGRFLRGTFKAATSKKFRDEIKQSGATYFNVLDLLLGTDLSVSSPKRIAATTKSIVQEKGNRVKNAAIALSMISGFKGVNAVNQITAAATGSVFARDMFKVAKNSPLKKRRAYAKFKLKQLGIEFNPKNKQLSENEMRIAMERFARKTQLQKDILEDPIIFNDPKFRPFAIFKRFVYRQSTLIKDLMKQDVFTHGNMFIPLRLVAGGLFGGELVNWSRDALKGLLSGEDKTELNRRGFESLFKDIKDSPMDRIIENLSAVGTIGFLTDLWDADNKTGAFRFVAESVLLSDMENIWKGIQALERNVESYGMSSTALRRSAQPFLRVGGGIASQLGARVKTEEQTKRYVSSAKGKQLKKIKDNILEDKSALGVRQLIAWNKAHPENMLTYEDINWKSMFEYELEKRAKRRKS